jgi:hypothetical protein
MRALARSDGPARGRAASDTTAALSKLRYDGFLACVDGAVHSGHPVGYVEEVAQIPSLGV